MWATLALTAALQAMPAQTGSFALRNPRATFGLLGQTRRDARYLLGDLVVVTYDLQNLKVAEDNVVQYSLGIEIKTRAGKSVYKLDPQDFKAELSLSGNNRPASSFYELPLDTAPGEYVMVVTGTDVLAKQTDKLEFPFEVLTRRLGFIQSGINLPAGQSLIPTAPMIPAGQTIIVATAVTGFELGPKNEADPKKRQPQVFIETRVIDFATGKPTLAKPKTGGVTEVAEEFKKVVPFTTALELNRPGRYRIEMKAIDKVANTTAEASLDVTVFELK